MFPSLRFPQSNLSHVARPQGSTIKPHSCSQHTCFQNETQSCSQATGFQNQTEFMFPGNRVPESNRCHVARPQSSSRNPVMLPGTGFHHEASVMFPNLRVPQSNLSHVARPQGSNIKPQSCSRKQVSRIKPMSCSQDAGFQYQSSSHVPSAQGSTIKRQSCCQSTGFCDQTTFKFPGHRDPE